MRNSINLSTNIHAPKERAKVVLPDCRGPNNAKTGNYLLSSKSLCSNVLRKTLTSHGQFYNRTCKITQHERNSLIIN
jgi:hypothetical protein